MTLLKNIFPRLLALTGLALILAVTFSKLGDSFHGYLDVRAALLVFLAPLLVLVLFGKKELQPLQMFERLFGNQGNELSKLANELKKETVSARSSYGFSSMTRFTETHADPLIQYAGELFSARFSPTELARLLSHRIQAEDAGWAAMSSTLGFLAKMAPYFGMLATVIGMIKLLENMSDFTRISGSMALAMQGTLYGLLSFTLVYAPLQRLANERREQQLLRNEMVVRWFVMIAEQLDAAYIERELQSLVLPVAHIQSLAIAPASVATPTRGLS